MIERLSALPATRRCLDLDQLGRIGPDPVELGAALGYWRTRADEVLARLFEEGGDVAQLVRARAWVMEQLVLTAWERLVPSQASIELCAVGGFGRGELHPHSDIDLLILKGGGSNVPTQALEQFVQVLWDADMHPGQSVRTVDDCVSEAIEDVGVATNLMEARLMVGSGRLYQAMRQATEPPLLWPADQFFAAKSREQAERHAQFEETVYNLEPNIKDGPGGLRDIQMIGWVTRRHFGTSTLHGLVEHDFLSEQEYSDLVSARKRLWTIRWALHQAAGRAEERLLFEYQRQLAARFGFGDGAVDNSAVERFMQRYYRTVMQVERLNERLLQSFDEELLAGRRHLPSGEIDRHFRIRHGYLELIDGHDLVRQPILLMRLFLVLSDHPDVLGVRASTIRLVREHLYLVDEEFRNDPAVLDAFLELLRRPRRVYSQLARMSRYGILAALLPPFGQITGRMQFDLFHVYTVDQHTLFVIRNLRRFAYGKRPEEFAHAIEIFGRIERPELLYLAALFHDIAKGRGGDHSELGAADAAEFVGRLDLPQADRDLVVWLVAEHLLMSRTSQREDISDPEVINRFAARVGSRRRLDHLFVLTVADIAATSPKLWNSWKDSLMWELYCACLPVLEQPDQAPDRQMSMRETRQRATEILAESGHEVSSIDALWQQLPDSAFLRLDAEQLAWTTDEVIGSRTLPLVTSRTLVDKGISELFVHAEDFIGLFAVVAREIDRMQLDVLAARVVTTGDGRSWDIFQVMDANGQPLNESDADRLHHTLVTHLAAKRVRALPPRPVPRRLKPFMGQAEISLASDKDGRTCLEVAATDRPGLLSAIAEALVACEVRLHDARVATFGQRVEDIFVISTADGQALDQGACEALENELRQRLDVEHEQAY